MFDVMIDVWVTWMNSFIKIVYLIFLHSKISKLYLKNF